MKYLILLSIAFISLTSIAQNKWRAYVPIGIDVGTHYPSVDADSASKWTSGLANSIHLKSGIGFIYNNRLGLFSEGGLLINTYSFSTQVASYSISATKLSLSCTPFVLFPFKKNTASNVHVGCGIGWIYNNADELKKNKPAFSAYSQSFGSSAITFAPEIGITRIEKKLSISLLGTYFYQNINGYTIKTTITDNNGNYTLQSKGDYLGLKIRFALRLGKDKVEPNIFKQSPPENELYVKRTNTVIRSFKTRKQYVTLEFFESNKIDHDSISVVVNGKYILVNHGLTNEKVILKVPLEKGMNTITVYALNEGDIPPNTATCRIRFGSRKEEFLIQTGKKKNASIEIEVK